MVFQSNSNTIVSTSYSEENDFINNDIENEKKKNEYWKLSFQKQNYEKNKNIEKCTIYKYEYDLVEPDENGFTHYIVHLDSGLAVGY